MDRHWPDIGAGAGPALTWDSAVPCRFFIAFCGRRAIGNPSGHGSTHDRFSLKL
jgi:hypothetical protein